MSIELKEYVGFETELKEAELKQEELDDEALILEEKKEKENA